MSDDARSSPSEPEVEPDELPVDPDDIVDEPTVLPPDASEADALDQRGSCRSTTSPTTRTPSSNRRDPS